MSDGLPTTGDSAQRIVLAGGKSPELRFLKTTHCQTVASYVLLSVDRAMEQAGFRSFLNPQGKVEEFVAKVASRLRIARNVYRSSTEAIFVTLMGLSEYETVPFSCWTEIVPYCFDCWPNLYERWLSFFKRNRVRLAFFTARQSAQYFSEALPSMRSIWLPEATDPSEFRSSVRWGERRIDVLELGRKNDSFHRKIAAPLTNAKRSHLFERVKGEVIFPERRDFVEGLANSKISICFPCSQTHPERSGPVETVTNRYFESMASKCVIVGHAPGELTELFGYNPVIETTPGHEFEQIESLLINPDSSLDIVERNYERLLEVGTWKNRIAQVLDTIREGPFRSDP